MASQSAMATTAAESRFRIDIPNSRVRSSLVVGLEKSSLPVFSELARQEWNDARFRTVVSELVSTDLTIGPDDLLLQSPDGAFSRLSDELPDMDVVVMFARSGDPAEAAARIGRACFGRNMMTAGFVLEQDQDRHGLEKTLSAVRPYVISLVVGPDKESLGETLSAIRA